MCVSSRIRTIALGFLVLDFLRRLPKEKKGLMMVPSIPTTDVQKPAFVVNFGMKRP